MKRHLRVGVQRGGRLVDDRYVPEQGKVTVGSSARATIALLGSPLPREQVLFHFHRKHPILHVTEGMTGEIALDGRHPEKLEALRSKGQPEAGGWALEIPDTARGYVRLGDATFQFQIGPKPPPPPRRSLPKAVRGRFLGAVETTFVGILVAVLSLEGLAVFAIHQRPEVAADQPTTENIDRFAEILMPEKPKEEPKKEDDAAKKAAEEAAKKAAEEAAKKAEEEKKKPEEPKEAPDPAKQAAAEAERKAKIREQVADKGLMKVIGAKGGGSGALANVFASGGFSDDIGSALAGAGGVKIATGDDSTTRREGSGAGPVGIGDLGAAAGGGGGRPGLQERKPAAVPQITFDDGGFETESASVDKESLGKYIRMRIKSVQQCYEKELKRNPSLRGKIVVRFVITTQGRVSDVSIDQNTMGDDNVGACIVSLIRRWTFPVKPEDDAPVSFPFVFSPGG